VAEALLSGASAQLRNAATIGGNVMQRTRCPYFQDVASACNRRQPGAGCGARDGENRTHAVLGWSEDCIATHASDFCVPLVALDAVVELAGPEGTRESPLDALHLLPGKTPEQETIVAPGELITGLRLSGESAAYAGNARYLKVRERTSFAFALVSAFAALRIEGDRIISARIALGGVAAKPWRAREAEAALTAAHPTASAFAKAADLALAGAQPSGDNAFKIDLARRIVARSLQQAFAGTPNVMPALPASPFSTSPGATHVS
jgi:xanthine dehydrogenase YagS FAD-binding subunit